MALLRQVEIILNTFAGTAQETELLTLLKEYVAGRPGWKISVARTRAELELLAKRAATNDCQIVVAAGGDGTVNVVASALVNTNKTMAVLPVGTLNHFAKDLRLPLDIGDALETINSGRVVLVDVGQVNKHVFVNNSSLGLYPSIVTERERHQRLGWDKWPAFVWAALLVLRRYPLVNLKLMVDGESFSCRTPFVFVGNNKYRMEGLSIGARDKLDEGMLSVYMTNLTGRLALLRLALRALFGGLRMKGDFAVLSTTELWIETRRRKLNLAADGEVSTVFPPLHYQILPKALRVVVPDA